MTSLSAVNDDGPRGVFPTPTTKRASDDVASRWTTYVVVVAQLLVIFARSEQRKSIPRRFYTTD